MQRSYPEIFLKLWETISSDLLWPKYKVKKISPLKIWSVFKGLDHEIINFQHKKTSHPETLIKMYRAVRRQNDIE